MRQAPRVLFLFFDGLGLAPPLDNPVAAASTPSLDRLIGVGGLPLTRIETEWLTYHGIDAALGMPGLPQSGTGHASLFAGFNAAREFGRHFGPWVPTTVRKRFARENLLSRARRAGLRVRFANAVPATAEARAFTRRPIGPPLAAFSAGVAISDGEALVRGEAVASGFGNERWRASFPHLALPEVTPRQAGNRLGELALGADLTLFAHYDLDLVGHRGGFEDAVSAVQRADEFVGGVMERFPLDEGVLVLTSDHGNVEAATSAHTRNPVPLVAAGSGAARFARVGSITGVADAVMETLRPAG